ncbi:MAG TPA: STAS domain-containing protein [bacterium]|nr:STAS domain-containing protein [bacterium]
MVRRPGIQGGADSARGEFIRFSTERVHEATVLRVEGEVDLSTANSFADAIESLYRENACVIVDLSRLSYLDGSGIRVLMRFAEEARGRFVVIGSTPTVHRVFVILNLLDVLPVVPSLGAAREYLGPK